MSSSAEMMIINTNTFFFLSINMTESSEAIYPDEEETPIFGADKKRTGYRQNTDGIRTKT